MAGPDILSRGFVYMRESSDLINEGQKILFNVLRQELKKENCNEYQINEALVSALQPFLAEKTDRHPMILSMIMDINQK